MTKFKIPIRQIVGEAYYRYKLESSTYNTQDNTIGIIITCTVKNIFGTPIADKTITLFQDNMIVSSQTTDEDGQATWTLNTINYGLHSFRVDETIMSVYIDNNSKVGHNHNDTYYTESEMDTLLAGKSNTNHTHTGWNSTSISNGTLYYNSAIKMCALRYNRTFNSGQQNTLYEWGQHIPSAYRPKYMVTGNGNRNGATLTIDTDGYLYGRFQLAFSSETNFYYHLMWHY